jgi:hypothetical protein
VDPIVLEHLVRCEISLVNVGIDRYVQGGTYSSLVAQQVDCGASTFLPDVGFCFVAQGYLHCLSSERAHKTDLWSTPVIALPSFDAYDRRKMQRCRTALARD